MANPSLPSKGQRYNRDGSYLEVEGLIVNDKVVMASQQANVPSYDITWTANEPTAGSTATIANGTTPTATETGQAIADLTAKVNALITALEAHGILADS